MNEIFWSDVEENQSSISFLEKPNSSYWEHPTIFAWFNEMTIRLCTNLVQGDYSWGNPMPSWDLLDLFSRLSSLSSNQTPYSWSVKIIQRKEKIKYSAELCILPRIPSAKENYSLDPGKDCPTKTFLKMLFLDLSKSFPNNLNLLTILRPENALKFIKNKQYFLALNYLRLRTEMTFSWHEFLEIASSPNGGSVPTDVSSVFKPPCLKHYSL